MKSKVLNRPMFKGSAPEEEFDVENVGIMQGFKDLFNDDDMEEGDEDYETGAMLGRTPDSPEILMNNLRGDMRSVDARRDELADLVGFAAAAETPEEVLAMLQPVLAQQGIGALPAPGMMPPPGMPPGPMPPMPMSPQGIPSPVGMPSPVGAPSGPMPASPSPMDQGPMPAPVGMANGGIVQRFSEGSTPPAGSLSEGAGSEDETVNLAALMQILNNSASQTPDIKTLAEKRAQTYRDILGSNQEQYDKQAMLDLAGLAFAYAGNVDPRTGQPMRGSPLSRFAQVASAAPGVLGKYRGKRAEEDRSLRLAALSAAESDLAARKKVEYEVAKEIAKRKDYELLSKDEAKNLGLDVSRGQSYKREKGTNNITAITSGSPQTILQMPAQKGDVRYMETVAGEGAKEDVELYNSATKAPANIEKHNRTIQQIQKSTTNTGFAAELINNINRVRAKILNDKRAGKEVTDTEVLNTMLGSEVFTMLPALGIGARGMDTAAERQFLLEVMTGNISLDKNTLLKMAETRRNLEVRAIEKFNALVDSGELDPFFEARNRKKKTIAIPALVPIGTAGSAGDPRNDPAVDAALGGGR